MIARLQLIAAAGGVLQSSSERKHQLERPVPIVRSIRSRGTTNYEVVARQSFSFRPARETGVRPPIEVGTAIKVSHISP
jgi:hypothetical protein